MPRALLLSVHSHTGRYHGDGLWPPSPARLFQALVAGAAEGGSVSDEAVAALEWLEGLPPPVICAPQTRKGGALTSYVPNNDLDTRGGDPARIAQIRTEKKISPRLFDARVPCTYLWESEAAVWSDDHAVVICTLAEGLYQLGRGVDLAWATAQVLDTDGGFQYLESQGGIIHRPAPGAKGSSLDVPVPGTLRSLRERFDAGRNRFHGSREGRTVRVEFTRPRKALLGTMVYDAPADHFLFDIHTGEDAGGRASSQTMPLALKSSVHIVEAVRDAMALRMTTAIEADPQALAITQAEVARFVMGQGAQDADKEQRIRIIPLPSVGHEYADHAIRRVLVERPQSSPLTRDTLIWACRGLEFSSRAGKPCLLVPSGDPSMLRHYAIPHSGMKARSARHWQSVTPVALPSAARHRIDPATRKDPVRRDGAGDVRAAATRLDDEAQAARAVARALRHANVKTRMTGVRVQREPFEKKGQRAELFAHDTRFSRHAMWHVKVSFEEAVQGPLVVGDGRYLGLGLMQPGRPQDVVRLRLEGETLPPVSRYGDLLAHLRRALMACDRDIGGHLKVSELFSGHAEDGAPLRRQASHTHVFLAAAAGDDKTRIRNVFVISPEACDRTVTLRDDLRMRFEEIAMGIRELRAGALGVFNLSAEYVVERDDALFGMSSRWTNVTPYRLTRYPSSRDDLDSAVKNDVHTECSRRGLPQPHEVIVKQTRVGNRGAIVAELTLEFGAAVRGPLLLGRDSHQGGGLFAGVSK